MKAPITRTIQEEVREMSRTPFTVGSHDHIDSHIEFSPDRWFAMKALIALFGIIVFAALPASAGQFSAHLKKQPFTPDLGSNQTAVYYVSGPLFVGNEQVGTAEVTIFQRHDFSIFAVVEIDLPDESFVIFSQQPDSRLTGDAFVMIRDTGAKVFDGTFNWSFNAERFNFTFSWPD